MVSAEDRGKEEGDGSNGLSEDNYIGRQITQIGNSKGVTMPANWLRRLGVDEGSSADLAANFDDGEVVLKFRD